MAADKAGVPFQGHSLRIGATLEYLLRGVPFEVVNHIGRWSSNSFTLYLRGLGRHFTLESLDVFLLLICKKNRRLIMSSSSAQMLFSDSSFCYGRPSDRVANHHLLELWMVGRMALNRTQETGLKRAVTHKDYHLILTLYNSSVLS